MGAEPAALVAIALAVEHAEGPISFVRRVIDQRTEPADVVRFRGDVLATAREACGYSQPELARLLNVSSRQRVVNWEQGREQPRARHVPELARLLGVSPFDLLGADPDTADLPALRTARGLAAHEVARRVNVSVPTYSRLERGIPIEISDEQLDVLAELLEVSVTRVRALVTRA